jgi:hypothetical protein
MRPAQTLKTLASAFAVYFIMAACSAAPPSSSPGAVADDGGANADSLGGPVPDARADGPTSGTRLRAKNFIGTDGSKQFATWHDTARNEDCAFMAAADGTVRCLPGTPYISAYSYFLDSSCTQPLIAVGTSCAPPKTALIQPVTNSACAAAGTGFRVYSVGSQYSGPQYLLDGQSCGAVNTSAYDFYGATEVPLSSFVQATVQVE